MIVKVKNVPVFHSGTRHEVGEEFEIKKEYHNDALFLIISEDSNSDEADLTKLKKDELQDLLDEKEIKYEAEATKKGLIALLNQVE